MRTEPPSQEEFDRMLAWLDPDRERAAERYEDIRRKLIKILVRRQCLAAEELADETINRVSHRVQNIAGNYEGDPALYFYAVAKKVYQEWLREEELRRQFRPLPPPEPSEDTERIHEYLERCRQELDPESRELILKYYEQDKRAKIEQRKELAEGLGITLNTLRMRVHRINSILQECIVDCLKDDPATSAGHVLAG